MIGARHLAVICATSLALVGLTLACGRYGPPVRPVPSGSASGDSGTFDNTPDARGKRPEEAVPYILQGLLPGSDSEGRAEGTTAQADEAGAEPGLEKKAQPHE